MIRLQSRSTTTAEKRHILPVGNKCSTWIGSDRKVVNCSTCNRPIGYIQILQHHDRIFVWRTITWTRRNRRIESPSTTTSRRYRKTWKIQSSRRVWMPLNTKGNNSIIPYQTIAVFFTIKTKVKRHCLFSSKRYYTRPLIIRCDTRDIIYVVRASPHKRSLRHSVTCSLPRNTVKRRRSNYSSTITRVTTWQWSYSIYADTA
ncbi:hypothetical protein D9M72_523000 [compost metagenome]